MPLSFKKEKNGYSIECIKFTNESPLLKINISLLALFIIHMSCTNTLFTNRCGRQFGSSTSKSSIHCSSQSISTWRTTAKFCAWLS